MLAGTGTSRSTLHEGSGERPVLAITSTVAGSGITSDVHSFLEIDLSSLPSQTYELELQVIDTLNGITTTSYLLSERFPLLSIKDWILN